MRWLSFTGLAIAAFFALLWAWQTVAAAVESRFGYLWFYLPAFVGLMLMCVPGIEVISARMRTGVSRESIAFDSGETIVSGNRLSAWTLPSALFAGAVACLAFSIGMFTHAYTFPMTAGQELYFPCIVGAMGLWFLVYVALLTTGQLKYPRIVCTPEVVSVSRGSETQSVEWKRIENLEAISLREYQRNSAIRISVGKGDRPTAVKHYRGPFASVLKSPPTITIKADQFDVGAVPLYWFLRYYLEHPEGRPELADGRAVDRLLSGALMA
ncbi:hypothetical protein [Rhodococcus sp. AG1013]|uniref:hypothetical protein n=1 Tax=Rhodococcus sp. AG1013 TaxID=2183996 RepID=UPI0011C05470|nr:hypothetical protein [Rhodococcus sp. AG1013]